MLTGPLAHQTQQRLQHQQTQELPATQAAIRSSKSQAPETAEKVTPDGVELWKQIQGILPDIRSQRLAYLLYNCGLKPKEIVASCPQEFDNVQEIYRLRCNIIEQILRSKILSDENP